MITSFLTKQRRRASRGRHPFRIWAARLLACLAGGGAALAAVGAAAVPAHASQPAHVTAYVANSFGNQVAAIDTTTSTLMTMTTVGRRRGHPRRDDRLRRHLRGRRAGRYRHQHRRPGDQGHQRRRRHRGHPGRETAYLTYLQSGLVCSSSTPDQVTAVDTATN
jgi:hypothetical protein